MDEDTCATNFMIRDAKMMQLVASDKEPITPYVRVVQSLHQTYGISTILVVGGTGDYFPVADHVLVMDSYRCIDATIRAKEIVAQTTQPAPPVSTMERSTLPVMFAPPQKRYPILPKLQCPGKIKILAPNIISYGDMEIDLSMTEQIISKHQANAIGRILQYLSNKKNLPVSSSLSMNDILDEMETFLDMKGADAFHEIGSLDGTLLRPRKLEVGAAINRLRIPQLFQSRKEQPK
jgi:predicted ABC-class ATPase